jgi:hypothetical protein
MSNSERDQAENKIRDIFWNRECRAIEAEAMLKLVTRIIEPDNSGSIKDDLLSRLSPDERYGLTYILRIIEKSMNENNTAMCDCHERKKVYGKPVIKAGGVKA